MTSHLTSSRGSDSSSAAIPRVARAVFVRNIGWGLLLTTGQTWVLCADGMQLVLSRDAVYLDCIGPDRSVERHRVTSGLPPLARARLAMIAQVVDQMRAHGHRVLLNVTESVVS